jgi:phage gp36-like protein
MTDTAYGTPAQVLAALHHDPAVDVTRLQEILNEVAAELDSALLSAGYTTVPVTGAKDLLLVRGFVVSFAAARTYRELYQNDETPEHIEAWETRWSDFLDRVVNGQTRLPDQQVASGGLRTGNIILWPKSGRNTGY